MCRFLVVQVQNYTILANIPTLCPIFLPFILVFTYKKSIFAVANYRFTMADNYLERQYAAYEERKKQLGKPKPKSSVKFYTRPGKKTEK